MKKLLSLLVLSGFLFLFGCTKNVATTDTTIPQQGAEQQVYESKTDGFSLNYPGDRRFQENVYGSSVMFFSPQLSGDTIKENMGIIKKNLDKDYSLTEYYAITKPELLKNIPGFTEVSNETIKVNNIDAQKLIYTGNQ